MLGSISHYVVKIYLNTQRFILTRWRYLNGIIVKFQYSRAVSGYIVQIVIKA